MREHKDIENQFIKQLRNKHTECEELLQKLQEAEVRENEALKRKQREVEAAAAVVPKKSFFKI